MKARIISILLFSVLSFPSQVWAERTYSESEIRSVESDKERKLRQLREQEIYQIRKVLGKRQPRNRKADLYFRLAELYLESYRAEFFLEGRTHEKLLSQGRKEKTIRRGRSKPFLRKGIRACREILKYKISFPKLDRVYFFLAFNNQELGNQKQAIHYYRQLVRKFPKSPFSYEGYRELGNHSYRKNQFKTAKSYYQKALQFGEVGERSVIYHRLAWSHYRTRETEQAISSLKKAIEIAGKDREQFVSINEELLRDLAVFYTETGRVEEAIRYYERVAGSEDFYPRLLEKLGREYERNVRVDKAILVYETILRARPDSEESFKVLVKLVELDLKRSFFDRAIERIKKGPILHDGDGEIGVASQNLKAMIRKTATSNHERYRKRKRKRNLVIAESYYSAYVDSFLKKQDKKKELPEIYMYLAEVKTLLGKPREASSFYREVVRSKDKRYSKEAATLWVSSLSESLNLKAKKKKKNRDQKPGALEKEFVSAVDELRENLPNSVQTRKASLTAAQVLAGFKEEREEAVKRAKQVMESYPKSVEAIQAARLWLQVLGDDLKERKKKGDFISGSEDLKEAIDQVKTKKGLMNHANKRERKKLRQLVATLETDIRIGTIGEYEAEKEFGSAAKEYESFANQSGASKLAEKAFQNAVSSYLRAEDLENTSRVSIQWLNRFPKGRLARENMKSVATRMLIEGKFEKSAELFEVLGDRSKEESSLLTAARIYSDAGFEEKGRDTRKKYLKTHSRSRGRFQVWLELGNSYQSAGKDSLAIEAYEACMKGSEELRLECGARLGDLYLRLRDTRRALTYYKKIALQGRRIAKKSSPFVGYGRFKIAQIRETEPRFKELSSVPLEKLDKELGKRLKYFQKLNQQYRSAIDAGGPWGVAALGRLATWASKLADEVDRIPSSTPELKRTLQTVSKPIRQTALQTFQRAYQKASKGKVFSPSTPSIADALADVGGKKPGRAQGPRGSYFFAGKTSGSFEQTQKALAKNPKDASLWLSFGNFLLKEKKHGLAKLCYERALDLNRRDHRAFNNLGVLRLKKNGEEDWLGAAQAASYFQRSLEMKPLFLEAKVNLGLLLNYYRLFEDSYPLFDQVLVKSKEKKIKKIAFDGRAVASFGLGRVSKGKKDLELAEENGASSSRFEKLYHQATLRSKKEAEDCVDDLEDLDDRKGFEREAVNRLMRTCKKWKQNDS